MERIHPLDFFLCLMKTNITLKFYGKYPIRLIVLCEYTFVVRAVLHEFSFALRAT